MENVFICPCGLDHAECTFPVCCGDDVPMSVTACSEDTEDICMCGRAWEQCSWPRCSYNGLMVSEED